jgi:hypothetical protein
VTESHTSARGWAYAGVGCLTTASGFFGGGMIAALVAKVVGSARGCVPPEGFPACNLWSFVLPGAIIGMIFLPVMAIRRMRRAELVDASADQPRG